MLPSVADQKKTLWKRRKKFNAFKNQLTKKLERCKKLRLKALKEILPDLIKKLKSNSFSKFEIIDDVAKLWIVLNDLEQDLTVSAAVKSKVRDLAEWLRCKRLRLDALRIPMGVADGLCAFLVAWVLCSVRSLRPGFLALSICFRR